MKKSVIIILSLLVLPEWVFGLNNFQPKNEWIAFNISTPPAALFVTDSSGRRAGFDPTLTFNSVGEQGDNLHGLEEIPNSVADQENIENDETNQPSSNTNWTVSIPDNGSQTYTVTLQGLKSGQGHLLVATGIPGKPKNGQSVKISYLISSGSAKQFTVVYNPGVNNINVAPKVSNGGLLDDIKSACSLNLILGHECDFLEDKAERIQKTLNNHRKEEAENLIESFLHNLGESKGDGDDDRDDRSAIKEPALSVLKADAEALLKSLPAVKHHDDDSHRE